MPTLLTELARSVGVALGRISRELAGGAAVRRRSQRFAPSSLGATEDQVNMQATVPARIDRFGTRVEDLGGTGVQDGFGG